MALVGLVVLVALVVLIVLVSKVHIWYNYFTVVQDVIEAFSELKEALWPIAKIFIALMQILGGLSSQLNISFPQAFKDFIKAFIGKIHHESQHFLACVSFSEDSDLIAK